jgi:ATP phosphoribosyltransferase
MELISSILQEIGFPIKGYTPDNRNYRPDIQEKGIRAKIFAEKDVVIQVAVGNYSIGFCGLDWIEEFRTKFPQSGVRILKKVGGISKKIYACCHARSEKNSIQDFTEFNGAVRMISEYPNLTEDFAIRQRIKRYTVFSAWGSVEAYPPEHAEIVVMAAADEEQISTLDLKPMETILESKLCIIVNQRDYETKDLSTLLYYLSNIK